MDEEADLLEAAEPGRVLRDPGRQRADRASPGFHGGGEKVANNDFNKISSYKLIAIDDPPDFRDRAYRPSLGRLPEKLDPQETKGKADWLKIFQDFTAVVDSSGVCLFTTFGIGVPQFTKFCNAATGVNKSEE